jgi:hypothetical protein
VKAIVHLKRDLRWAGEVQLFEPLPWKRVAQAKHIAAVLIAACFSGCGYAMVDADTTV